MRTVTLLVRGACPWGGGASRFSCFILGAPMKAPLEEVLLDSGEYLKLRHLKEQNRTLARFLQAHTQISSFKLEDSLLFICCQSAAASWRT